MAWVVNSGIRADAIISTIETNLTANGWTETDGTPYFVFSSTNSQGVTQYVQITQSGTYLYIQLQGWRAWTVGSHTGSNGSSTSYGRIYLGPVAIAAATLVDLYMSITANRIIILIDSKTTNYRNWAYFGGLDTTIAGTADPNCVCLLSSYEQANTYQIGQVLLWQGGGSYYWPCMILGMAQPTLYNSRDDSAPSAYGIDCQGLPLNGGKMLLYPLYVIDLYSYSTAYGSGVGPVQFRGMMDGLLFAPIGNSFANSYVSGGALAHLDTVIVGATTYLIFQPGGQVTAQTHPITGNYNQALAVPEV